MSFVLTNSRQHHSDLLPILPLTIVLFRFCFILSHCDLSMLLKSFVFYSIELSKPCVYVCVCVNDIFIYNLHCDGRINTTGILNRGRWRLYDDGAKDTKVKTMVVYIGVVQKREPAYQYIFQWLTVTSTFIHVWTRECKWITRSRLTPTNQLPDRAFYLTLPGRIMVQFKTKKNCYAINA